MTSTLELKTTNPEVKDSLIESVKKDLSSIASRLDESNVKSVLAELKITTEKLNSFSKTKKVTVSIGEYKYYFQLTDDKLYINDKLIVLYLDHLNKMILTQDMDKAEIEYFNDRFSIPAEMRGMATIIPLFVYICHSLLHKSVINHDFILRFTDKAEFVNIIGATSTSIWGTHPIDPFVKYAHDVNCLAMKIWIDNAIVYKECSY